MRIKTSFFGPIRRPWPEESKEIEIKEGTKVQGLLLSLGFEESELRRLAVVLNGRKVSMSKELLLGDDDLRVVLLAGGG